MTWLRQISPMQILLLLVLTVALYFGVAFSGELIASRRITLQVSAINADITRLQADNVRLRSAVAQASSDAFIEREARERLGLVRPGDVPVIISNLPAPPPAAVKPPPPPKAHWEKWRDLL